MATTPYVVTIWVQVHDETALFEAAHKHARAVDGLSYEQAEELLRPNGDIDVDACLIMALDPGSLDGCNIHETTVE